MPCVYILRVTSQSRSFIAQGGVRLSWGGGQIKGNVDGMLVTNSG